MKRLFAYTCLAVLCFGSVRQLFVPGYFPMHDDTQIARVVEMGRSLREGQFPVRWVENLGYGYGYPIFNFYGPLPYYIGGSLYALGVPALLATKIMFGLGVVAPAFVLFSVMSTYTGMAGALVGALLYLYAPYHAVQIYVRGAVGEYYILIFWPLIVHAFLLLQEKAHRVQGVVLGSLSIAGAVISHTLLGYATVLFVGLGILLWLMVRLAQGRRFLPIVKSAVLLGLGGLSLSAFFWLPAVFEMAHTSVSSQVGGSSFFADHFVCPVQLWSMSWGYGGSSTGCVHDGLSFMLGKLHILLAIVTIISWKIGLLRLYRPLLWMATAIALAGVFMTLHASLAVWRFLPMFAYLQYPWRFLSVAGFGIAMLGGISVGVFHTTWHRAFVAIVLCSAVFFVYEKRFVAQTVIDAGKQEYISDIRWRASRISDEYLPAKIIRPNAETNVRSATIVSDDPVTVSAVVETVVFRQYIVEATAASSVRAMIAYFPGWVYRVNDTVVFADIQGGFPSFSIDAGQSVITMTFTDTMIRTIANIISVAALCTLGYVYGSRSKTIS